MAHKTKKIRRGSYLYRGHEIIRCLRLSGEPEAWVVFEPGSEGVHENSAQFDRLFARRKNAVGEVDKKLDGTPTEQGGKP